MVIPPIMDNFSFRYVCFPVSFFPHFIFSIIVIIQVVFLYRQNNFIDKLGVFSVFRNIVGVNVDEQMIIAYSFPEIGTSL